MAKVIYTSVTQKFNKIYFRGYKDGKRIQSANVPFKPCLYVPTNDETSVRSLHGKNLRETSFNSVSDAKAYLKQYRDVQDIHGNTSFEYDFIHRNFKGEQHVTITDLTVLSLDIETTVGAGLVHGKSNFPDVFDPHDQVLLITLQDINTSELITFGTRPYTGKGTNYILCRTEADLLTKFIEYIIQADPDIITGWNVILFDIAYLGSRITKILGERALDRLSPFNNVERKVDTIMDKEYLKYEIQGRVILDLLELYKKFRFINRPAYSLKYISQVELGETKLEYAGTFKEHYTNNWDGSVEESGFVAYNIRDVELVSKLENKLGLIYLAVTLAYLTKVNFDDVYSPVRTWESYILSTLYEENTFCGLKHSSKSDHQIMGGYVKDPIPGRYKWTGVLDAASMYPSFIMALNMSPETIVDMIPGVTIDLLLENKITNTSDYCLAANGSRYRKDIYGVMPRLTKLTFDKRKQAKAKMLQLKSEYEKTHDPKVKQESARYGVLQLALKINLNSLFGAMANQHFIFFDNRIAEGITSTGQYSIQKVSAAANEYMSKVCKSVDDYVVYNDTDSLCVRFDKLVELNKRKMTDNETVDFILRFNKEYLGVEINKTIKYITQLLNFYEDTLYFKPEAISSTTIVLAKKRNIQRVLDNEGVRYAEPDYKVTGIETNRSSTPDLVREWLMDAIKLILDDHGKDALLEYIEKRRVEFRTYSVEDIAFPRSANNLLKFTDPVNIYTGGTPIAVRAALLYNDLVKKNNLEADLELIQEGQKIRYIALLEPNTLKENIIGFPVELPKQFNLHRYVDYDTQFQKAFLDPLTKIMDALNWKLVEVESLDSFF
jgi:DNA polymerase elongation subunit (family B)